MADRAFIGIPADDVEYNHISFSHVELPIRERPGPSAGQISDHVDEVYSYDGSHSGTASIACPVFTPQSESDAPSKPQPQIVLNGSWTSSTGGADSLHTPSVSDIASPDIGVGMDAPTHLSTQAQASAWRLCTPEALSSSSEVIAFEQTNLLGGMGDPQHTIRLNQDDLDFLEELQRIQSQSQRESSPHLLDRSHPLDYVPQTPALEASSPVAADTWTVEAPAASRTQLTPVRTAKASSRSPHTRKDRAALTSSGREKAGKLRKVGACLRCLVNHETVRTKPEGSSSFIDVC